MSGASRCLRFDLAQEGTLFRQDELVFFGEIEIRHAFRVVAQPRAIGLVGGQELSNEIRAKAVLLVPSCGIQ